MPTNNYESESENKESVRKVKPAKSAEYTRLSKSIVLYV